MKLPNEPVRGVSRLFAACITALVLLAAPGCGGDDDSVPGATTVAADQSLAESLRLTRHDFPDGWEETPDQPGESESPLDKCDPGDAPGRTGLAATGDFKQGSDSVSNSVAVFQSPDAALAALDRIPAQGACMVAEIKGGALNDETFEALDATFEPFSFPATGDRVDAHRFAMKLKQLSSGAELTVTLDLVYVVKGRVGYSLSAQGVLTPVDGNLLEALAATMAGRLP